MEQGLRILGDALSIASLSIIAAVALSCWKRILPQAKVPMRFGRDGKPSYRASKPVALLFIPAVLFVLLIVPTLTGATHNAEAFDGATILFGMRALMAGAFALGYIIHMRAAMQVLADEGQLRS
jgi:uncharacterized membrane protein